MENQNHIPSATSQNAPSRTELEQHLRARAWKDDAFRQEFLTDPQAVLERDYAQYFPEGKIPSERSIKVIEEEEQAIYFVLPPKKAADDNSEIDEIDEAELFDVSGGTTWGCGELTHGTSGVCCSSLACITNTCPKRCDKRLGLIKRL